VTGYGFIDAQYMRVITEAGFLGLIFFFILMGTIFRETYDSLKKAKDPFFKGLSMGFIAGFVGLLFHGLGANTFIIVRIMEPFWFMAALVVMIPKLEEDVEM
jgi:O-antigen ligase